MFLFILQTDEQPFDELTLFLFIGLAIVWFISNKFKSRASKTLLWIIGSVIIIIGILLSIFTIPNDSILFGVVVIFFGITIIPLKDIFKKLKSKISKPNSKPSKEVSNEPDHNYPKTVSEEYISKGKELKNRKKYKKAIDTFVKSLSIYPDSPEPWFELGEINLIRKRTPEALTCYHRALDIKPSYREALERYKEVEQMLKESENKQD